jgi:hypothetical protein
MGMAPFLLCLIIAADEIASRPIEQRSSRARVRCRARVSPRSASVMQAHSLSRQLTGFRPNFTSRYDATNPMLKWDTACRALRDAAGLPGLRFQDLRHTVITELAEMGVADHVLESISGHLSRRMLEHYSHIRIDAKRQALDALDAARRSPAHNGGGNGDGANQTGIPAIVEVRDELTSQSRHSLVLRGSPPAGKLLIPLERRDVRVVEGARLESVCRGNSTVGSNPTLSANYLPVSF